MRPPGYAGNRKQWARNPGVIKAVNTIIDRRIDEYVPDPSIWAGRGIVIAGGYGMKPVAPHGYFPSAYVLVRKLRHLGCQLPIQLWHLGPYEMDAVGARIMADLGVMTVDANLVARTHPARILCGWELKPYSVLHSPFQEVLFLDADNLPLRNPEECFDWKRFRETGAVFWPDYLRWDLDHNIWRYFQMKHHRDPAFESGQYLIDKARCAYPLRLALLYCEYSDYTFEHVYGDKETFHLAWRKLNHDYAMPRKRPGWNTHTIIQHDMEGRILFLHRCQDKWRYDGHNQKVMSLPDEQLHWSFARELTSIWHGQPWMNVDPNENEELLAASLAGRTFLYERVGHGTRPMRLEAGGQISLGNAGCERQWDSWIMDGKALLAIRGKDGLTCLLELFPDGSWRGRWLIHEKMEIVLTPQ